jgi:hypothetical protein
VAAVVLLAGACSDDGDEAEPPDAGQTTPSSEAAAEADVFARDACELLTDEQAGDLLGDAVTKEATPGEPATSQPSSCSWSGAGGVDLGDPQLTGITVFLGDHQIYDNTRVLAEDGDTFEELDGVGDEAYAGDAEGGVLVGDAGITVSPIGTDANDPATHDLVVDLLGLLAENA